MRLFIILGLTMFLINFLALFREINVFGARKKRIHLERTIPIKINLKTEINRFFHFHIFYFFDKKVDFCCKFLLKNVIPPLKFQHGFIITNVGIFGACEDITSFLLARCAQKTFAKKQYFLMY